MNSAALQAPLALWSSPVHRMELSESRPDCEPALPRFVPLLYESKTHETKYAFKKHYSLSKPCAINQFCIINKYNLIKYKVSDKPEILGLIIYPQHKTFRILSDTEDKNQFCTYPKKTSRSKCNS